MNARSSRRSRVLLFIVVALLPAACVHPIAPPYAEPTEEARRVVAVLADRWHAFTDLRTLADVRIEQEGERRQFTGVLLARSPASVRVEALSPLGHPLMLATIHEGRLTAYDAAAHSALVGPATSETAARLLNLPFDPEDLVGVLAGRPALPKDLRTAVILDTDDRGPSIELTGGINSRRVWMDFATGLVRQVEITGGRYAVRVAYVLGDDGWPRGFDLTAAQGHISGTVRYHDPVYGGGVDVERFSLTLPAYTRIEEFR